MLPATRCSPSSKISEIIPIAGPAQPMAARGSRSHRWHNAHIGIIAVLSRSRHNGDFEDYWRFHLRQEHKRIHGAIYGEDLILAA